MTTSEVFSIRIPKELKEKIEELKDVVNWKEELVRFLERRVGYYQKLKTIKEVRKILEGHPTLPRGSATKAVREDRDSH